MYKISARECEIGEMKRRAKEPVVWNELKESTVGQSSVGKRLRERGGCLGEKSTGLLKASNTVDSNCLKATGRPDR